MKKLSVLTQADLELIFPPLPCAVCGRPITDEHSDEIKTIDGKAVDADCYFAELSSGVEANPICTPRIRRG